MKKDKIIYFLSIIISLIFPIIIISTLYGLLNFINFIYVNKALEFLYRNKIIIICIFIFIILAIKLIKYTTACNYFSENKYLTLALIGQTMNCFIFLVIIITLFIPIISLPFYHFVVAQLYFYILFENHPIIPMIINLIIIGIVTIIVFILSSIIPIIYTKKAIILVNNNNEFNKINEKMEYINPIRILIHIIKIKKAIK
ncbi:MAG: hypothetical protein LBU88_07180 [Treponema sp.]|jgi:hypothetical protein|nr:hypothetical protein [Treponema sp.]